MRLLGVFREKVFSPGKIADDAAILDMTLRELRGMGHEFAAVEAEKLKDAVIDASCILTMAQSIQALEILNEQQKRGAFIINSVSSVRDCYRKPLFRVLKKAGLPLPWSEILTTNDVETALSFEGGVSYWLKRGDVHAIEPGDVVRVRSSAELTGAVAHFKERRIDSILVQEHVEGDVIKFYGAGRGSFFSAFRANGEEVTSGTQELRRIARRAARVVGLDVYGGDAIVMPGGEIRLIDVNDWPSFSRCAHKAAIGIAGHIAGMLRRN